MELCQFEDLALTLCLQELTILVRYDILEGEITSGEWEKET